MMKVLFAFFLSSFFSLAGAVELSVVEAALKGDGAVGWIHGADHENRLYVFTYRNPDNFFDNVNLPLIPKNSQAYKVLKDLKRHDLIRVKGSFQKGERVQTHIWADDITVEKVWNVELPNYSHEVVLPEGLPDQGKIIVKVHAVFAEGHILVVDYNNTILPLVVDAPLTSQTSNLFRGDKVRVDYIFRTNPDRPVHIALNPNVEKPVEILDSILTQHGSRFSFEGDLVMFPASPQIKFNVFALMVDVGDGVYRDYTLVNFTDPDLFAQIREKLQKAWDESSIPSENARNKLIKKGLRVRGTGSINVIDPNQANPQILLETIEGIQLL